MCKIKRYILFTLLLISCKQYKNPIPDFPVRLEFNITADAPELAAFNGYKEFTVPKNATQYLGYGGILVFHTIDDKFYAFDMACPYEVKPTVKVHCNYVGVAVCDSCKTQFSVVDGNGYVQSGVAKYPLKKYQVYYDNLMGNVLVIN